MITYHYHAIYQPAYGQVCNIDGLIKREKPPTTMEEYQDIKKAISPDHWDKLTICSFTLVCG